MNEAPACPVGKSHAMGYIQEIQKRFLPDRADVFQQFLNILNNYAKEPQLESVHDIRLQVQSLFSNDPDLLEGFEQFLPEFTPKQQNDKAQPPAEADAAKAGKDEARSPACEKQ